MKTEFKWDKPPAQIAKEKTGGDDGLKHLSENAKVFMDPYVPADNFVLAQNTSIYVENGVGIVEYKSPYAHYQYHGVAYGPNYPIMDGSEITGWYSPPHKTPTGKKLKHSTFRHPLATSEWDKAMLKARKVDLTKAMQQYIDRGGK